MPQRRLTRGLAIVIAALAVLVAVPLATAAARAQTLNLTAFVKKHIERGEAGDTVLLILKKGSATEGKVSFPICAGSGESVICGGSANIKGLGTNLQTKVTFVCPPEPPFTCKPGVGVLETKRNVEKGTITLKVQPDKIETGASFPVTVREKKGQPTGSRLQANAIWEKLSLPSTSGP